MKIVRFILNIVLSFVLMCMLICVTGLDLLNKKILDKDFILTKVDETGFYNQLSKEINDGFENYVYQSGLPEDTIQNLFDDEQLKNDINSIVSYIYGENEYHTSEDIIKTNIDTKINAYLETNNIILNDRGKANIDNYEALIIKEYNKKIIISEKAIETARETIAAFKKINSKIRKYPVVVAFIAIVLLAAINYKNLLNAINYVGIALLSAGVIYRIGIVFINKNIKFDSLMIYSKSTTNLLVNVAKEVIFVIEDYSNFFVVCGAVAILITAILNGIEKKAYQEADDADYNSKVGNAMKNFGTSSNEISSQEEKSGSTSYNDSMVRPPKRRFTNNKPKRRKNRY